MRNMTDDILVKALKNGGYDDIEKVGLMDATGVGRLKLPNTSTGAEIPLNESDKQVLKVALLFFALEDKAAGLLRLHYVYGTHRQGLERLQP